MGLNSIDQFENNYFTEMCSGPEAGSYSRLIDFVYHPTVDLRVIKKKRTREIKRVIQKNEGEKVSNEEK